MGTVEIICFITIIGIIIFLFLKNKDQNRRIDRQNRVAEKQEELLQSLRKKEEPKTGTDAGNL